MSVVSAGVMQQAAESLPLSILREILSRAVVLPSDIAMVRRSSRAFPRLAAFGGSLLEFAAERLRDVQFRTNFELFPVASWPVVDQRGADPLDDRPHNVTLHTAIQGVMRSARSGFVRVRVLMGTEDDDSEDLVDVMHDDSEFRYDPRRGRWQSIGFDRHSISSSFSDMPDDAKIVAIVMLLRCASLPAAADDSVAARRREMCQAAAASLERGVTAASAENLDYNPWGGANRPFSLWNPDNPA